MTDHNDAVMQQRGARRQPRNHRRPAHVGGLLAMISLREWWHAEDPPAPSRLVALLFERRPRLKELFYGIHR
jgi:hypothetical protein